MFELRSFFVVCLWQVKSAITAIDLGAQTLPRIQYSMSEMLET